jgi:hypothetical protein
MIFFSPRPSMTDCSASSLCFFGILHKLSGNILSIVQRREKREEQKRKVVILTNEDIHKFVQNKLKYNFWCGFPKQISQLRL